VIQNMIHLQQVGIQTQNIEWNCTTHKTMGKRKLAYLIKKKIKKDYVLKFQIIKCDLKTHNLKLYSKHKIAWTMFTHEPIPN